MRLIDNAVDAYAVLKNRSCIRVSGPESFRLLQGLTTNQMNKIEKGGDGLLSLFLESKGRVLADSFIYPDNRTIRTQMPSVIIDVDSGLVDLIETHLKKHVLRSKIDIQRTDQVIIQAWGPSASKLWQCVPHINDHMPIGSFVAKHGVADGFVDIGCKDPRHPLMGVRFVVDHEKVNDLPLPKLFNEKNMEEYQIRRMLLGIPEGPVDIPTGSALPLESNFDYIPGIDFRKGCYLGQELTIRTYHIGVTRKRIVPVMLYDDNSSPPSDSNFKIENDKEWQISPNEQIFGSDSGGVRSIGKIRSTLHNIGLALMRLDFVEKGDLFTNSGIRVKGFIPDWWSRPFK